MEKKEEKRKNGGHFDIEFSLFQFVIPRSNVFTFLRSVWNFDKIDQINCVLSNNIQLCFK